MDYVLLGFLLFFCVVGIFKGFVRTVFSLISIFLIAFVAWKLCPLVSNWLMSSFGNSLSATLTGSLDALIPGSFADVSQFQSQISQNNFVFTLLLNKILSNVSFEGNLTAGQILAPTLSNLLIKVISFTILFVALLLVTKILRFCVEKLIKICGLTTANRLFGGIVGMIKGLLYFILFYAVFCAFASFSLNENLLNFVSTGTISKNIYDFLIEKIINLFY